MSAGMVSVPAIVPLKVPGSGRKWQIDSETPIELYTSTKDTTIFYTVDGTKPDPYKKIGKRATYRYSEPFYLSPGKKTVKAIAFLNNGSKESSVNTKTFQVQKAVEVIDPELEENEEESPETEGEWKQLSDRTTETDGRTEADNERTAVWSSNSLFKSLVNNKYMDEPHVRGHNMTNRVKNGDDMIKKVINGSDFKKLTIRDYDKPVPDVMSSQNMLYSSDEFPRAALPPRSMIKARSEQVDMNFMRCIYCHAQRPTDPYARFCNECGAPVPPVPGKQNPSEYGTVGECQNCHCRVSLSIPNCVICEAPLGSQWQPQVQQSEKVVCLQCGTSSPSGSKHCVVCEALLPVQKVFTQNVVNKGPFGRKDVFLQCSRCGRINSCDARFCDWCGSKPLTQSSIIACPSCKSSNHPYAKYCSSCGMVITPPLRPEFEELLKHNGISSQKAEFLVTSSSGGARWISIPAASFTSVSDKVGNKTSGLYHPPQKERPNETEMNGSLNSLKYKKQLTGVSPGKGYWRQQMDHICQHLKVYAQNNPEFRESIGQPKIGKLLAAVAQEELDGQELTVTVNFALRNKDHHTLKATARSVQSASTFLRAIKDSQKGRNGDGDTDSIGSIKKKKKKVGARKKSAVKLSAETQKLLQLMNFEYKKSDISDEVKGLLEDGADPNGENPDGITPLKLAVLNKHFNCIPILIRSGANIDLKSGVKGNTALHEAVLKGLDGTDAVSELLESDADTDIVNKAGISSYDLAVKSGIDSLISKFTAKIGEDILKETTKVK